MQSIKKREKRGSGLEPCALRGRQIIGTAQWEEGQWELFSAPGDEFSSEQVRVVPLVTLLAFDPSLVPVSKLEIGEGLLRDVDNKKWTTW